MMKKTKILVLCVMCILSVMLAVGCGSKTGGVLNGKPAYPSLDMGNAVSTETSALTKDESGLFSTTLGITDVTYNSPIPQIYADIEDYDSPKTGVRFDSNISGAQVYYNRVLDLNKIDGDVITFEVLHNDDSQISSVEVELIDIYDASKKVKVSWSYISSTTVTDTLVSCNSVSAAGNNVSTEDFGKLRLQYGATNYLSNLFEELISWYGNGQEHRPFNFTFDTATNEVRADVGEPENQKDFLLLDVDNPIHMGDDVFDGFTTGEVYLRLNFADISGKGAVVITSIGGVELSGESLTLEPSTSLKVKFDNFAYASEMPVGMVGKKYAVPEAENNDLLRGEYIINRMVTGPDGEGVAITDNSFVPESAGKYKLVYSARDINNFLISKEYDITVLETISAMTLTPTRNTDNFYNALEKSLLPSFVVSGGSGIPEVEVGYMFNGEKILPDALGYYTFGSSGTLKVSVKASDYLGNVKEAEFEYAVKSNPKLKFLSPMPSALAAGSEFTVPDFIVEGDEAGDYVNKSIYFNKNKLDADRKITVPSEGTVKFDYYAENGNSQKISQTFELPVYSPFASGNISGLFVAEGSSVVSQESSGVTVSATDNNNAVSFANPLSAMMAELYFRDATSVKYEYLEVTLTDSFDAANSVVFRVYNNATLTENFRVQDKNGTFDTLKYGLSSSVAAAERKHFYYDNSDHSIYNLNLVKIAELEYCTDGSIFTGFTRGVMNVSFRFCNVKERSDITLLKLGNQPLDVNAISYGDLIAPQLAPISNIESENIVVYSDFIVPSAFATDIICGISTISVSFTAPDKTVLLSEADCNESRIFKLDKLGTYLLAFNVEDLNGVTNKIQYYITVIDNIAPEITVDGEYDEEYAFGSEITLAGMSVTDNIDSVEAINSYILICNPDYTYEKFSGGDVYKFDREGYYRILYCAFDSSGNYNVIEFTFNVR